MKFLDMIHSGLDGLRPSVQPNRMEYGRFETL